MSRWRRICSWLLCLAIVLVLFVSSAYAVHEAGHVCHGADCRICETVRQAEALVQSFALLAGIAVLALTFMRCMQVFQMMAGTHVFAPCTLISWKVRLNNEGGRTRGKRKTSPRHKQAACFVLLHREMTGRLMRKKTNSPNHLYTPPNIIFSSIMKLAEIFTGLCLLI